MQAPASSRKSIINWETQSGERFLSILSEQIVSPAAVRQEFYYGCPEGKAPITIWDRMGTDNPIAAAIAAADDEGERVKTERHVEILDRELSDGVILDLGCGYGRLAKYLLPRRPFRLYVGQDGSTVMLRLFHERHRMNPAESQTPLTLIHSPIDEILLKDRSVDSMFSVAVFLHNPRTVVARAIAEAHRVLRDGGTFIILGSFPNRLTGNGLAGFLYLTLLKLRGQGDRNGPVRYFSENQIRALFESFDEVRIERVGFNPIPRKLPFVRAAPVNLMYEKCFSEPVTRLLSRLFSDQTKSRFCYHFDVRAIR